MPKRLSNSDYVTVRHSTLGVVKRVRRGQLRVLSASWERVSGSKASAKKAVDTTTTTRAEPTAVSETSKED